MYKECTRKDNVLISQLICLPSFLYKYEISQYSKKDEQQTAVS